MAERKDGLGRTVLMQITALAFARADTRKQRNVPVGAAGIPVYLRYLTTSFQLQKYLASNKLSGTKTVSKDEQRDNRDLSKGTISAHA